MKAVAVFPDKRAIDLIERAEPALSSPTEVKLRMLEVGVCGTDREISAFEYGTPPAGFDYLGLGHEGLAEVVEVGPAVSAIRRGDLVVPMVRRPCRHAHCRPCRAGRQDFCETGDFTERGIKEAHGFMTDFVVDDERYLTVVPRELRDVAVLVEPLTIAEKAIDQFWQVQRRVPGLSTVMPGEETDRDRVGNGRRAVVLGAGPVGLLGAMLLRSAGFDTYVYSRSPAPNEKADLAQAIGATYVSSQTDSAEQLAEQVGNIDLVYEAVGASTISFNLLTVLGVNGVFIFTGVPPQRGPIEVNADVIMRNLVLKNQLVLGTVNAGRDAFEAAIRDLGSFRTRWPAAVRSLITGRYPVEGFRDLLLGRAGGIKNILVLDQTTDGGR